MVPQIMNFKEFLARDKPVTESSEEGVQVGGGVTVEDYMQEIAPKLLTAKLHTPMNYSAHMQWVKAGMPALSSTEWEIETDTDLDDDQPKNMTVFAIIVSAPDDASQRDKDLASAFHLIMHAEIEAVMHGEGDPGDHHTPPSGPDIDVSFKFTLTEVCDEDGETVLTGDEAKAMFNYAALESRLHRDGEKILASKVESITDDLQANYGDSGYDD